MKIESIRKIKIAGIIIGVTVAVYLSFRFLLPLVAPFVFALLIAIIIDRPVGFLVRKLRWKRVICTIIMLFVVLLVVGILVFLLGRILLDQLRKLGDNYMEYAESIKVMASRICSFVDGLFGLNRGSSFDFLMVNTKRGVEGISDSIIPTVMHSSINVVTALVWFFTTITLVIMGAVFFSKDMEKMRAGVKNSVFKEEICFIGGRMKEILGTYFKTQFIIMSITSIICMAGLYLMGNPYGFLIGILVGLVDALPVLGTGTVFLPWGIILIFMGRYPQAAGIFAIYLVCYYVRQFLEPKLMGNNLGVSPILMLISLYLGLVLFGITGVITGPIAAILIREISLRAIKNL